MTLHAVRLLQERRPDTRLGVCGQPHVAEVYRRIAPEIALHPIAPKAGWVAHFRLARQLRRERYELALLFRSHLKEAVVARAAGVGRVAGFRSEGNSLLLHRRVKKHRGRHYAQNFAYLLEAALDASLGELPPVHMPTTRSDRIPTGGRAVGLGFGGPHKLGKAYPVELAREVTRAVMALGARPVFLGDDDDRAAVAAIVADLGGDGWTDLTGRTSVAELIDAIGSLDVLCGIDSAPVHIAAAADVPVVVIGGRSPTPLDRVVPMGERVHVARPSRWTIRDEALAGTVRPERLVEAIERFLALPRSDGPPCGAASRG